MSPNDPTDNALAAIASILDQKEPVFDYGERGERGIEDGSEPAHVVTETVIAETVVSETVVSETTTVTIVTTAPVTTDAHEPEADIATFAAPATVPDPEPEPEPSQIDGYSRSGPGPLDAIRFCWTARRDDDGQYFVDETIGSSRPISAGPMPAREVVRFINERERSAWERFDTLKNQMTLGSPARIGSD